MFGDVMKKVREILTRPDNPSFAPELTVPLWKSVFIDWYVVISFVITLGFWKPYHNRHIYDTYKATTTGLLSLLVIALSFPFTISHKIVVGVVIVPLMIVVFRMEYLVGHRLNAPTVQFWLLYSYLLVLTFGMFFRDMGWV